MWKFLTNLIKGKTSELSFFVDKSNKNEDKKSIINKLLSLFGDSVKGSKGETSSTRIQGYMTMGLVYAFAIMFIGIEWSNAWHSWPKTYTPSNQSVVIFSMILAHHLGILFNKIRENKYNPVTTDVAPPIENTEVPPQV